MRERRIGLAVWIKHPRLAKNLRKYGTIHYVSKRLNYVSMYVGEQEIDQVTRELERLNFVLKVERSHRHEIPTEYNNAKPDKQKEFDYQLEKNQLKAIAESLLIDLPSKNAANASS
ncbi:YlbG family protein [Brevibacillus dissolubilis]|uniref:YlbG family protein n=1 Tax=Brevibacillus dissolubilis TaxID=1844116 RepID=UPI001115C20D|nr:YlbG family protein [Brevibacillus dissolubilis]